MLTICRITHAIVFAVVTGPTEACTFLPSDAQFSGSLTSFTCKLVGDDLLVEYELPTGGPSYMGGRAYGVKEVMITDARRVLKGSLDRAEMMVRRKHPRNVTVFLGEDGVETPIETNKIRIFVHNMEFNPSRFSPFMRYNEDWVREAQDINNVSPRIMGVLPDFEHFEWRDAAKVPPLKHVGSKVDPKRRIECAADDIKIYVIAAEDVDVLEKRQLGEGVSTSDVEMLCVKGDTIERIS